jgi:hypothetical protein
VPVDTRPNSVKREEKEKSVKLMKQRQAKPMNTLSNSIVSSLSTSVNPTQSSSLYGEEKEARDKQGSGYHDRDPCNGSQPCSVSVRVETGLTAFHAVHL